MENIKYAPERSIMLIADILDFAMNDGGTIYIGIKEDGEVIGLDNANLVLREVDMSIISTYPELVFSTRSTIEIIEGKEVLKIDVLLDGFVDDYVMNNLFYCGTKNTFIPIEQIKEARYRFA